MAQGHRLAAAAPASVAPTGGAPGIPGEATSWRLGEGSAVSTAGEHAQLP